MAVIDSPEKAMRLARAIASDISLYNEEKIREGIENDTFFDAIAGELEEGRPTLARRERFGPRPSVESIRRDTWPERRGRCFNLPLAHATVARKMTIARQGARLNPGCST